jgi:hypothetical protein
LCNFLHCYLVPRCKYILLFIFSGTAAQRGLWPPRSRGFLTTHNDAPQSVGLLWTSDQLVAETSTWQQKHTQQTNIHTSGWIRTYDCSMLAAVNLRLRPRGHWDLRLLTSITAIFSFSRYKLSLCVLQVAITQTHTHTRTHAHTRTRTQTRTRAHSDTYAIHTHIHRRNFTSKNISQY